MALNDGWNPLDPAEAEPPRVREGIWKIKEKGAVRIGQGITGVVVMLAFGFVLTQCVSNPPQPMKSLSTHSDLDSAAASREQMVKNQLEYRGIRDARVLTAMRKVPRDRFVPPEFRDRAYDDGALPIGYEQTISQPYIVAYMTEALQLIGKERVLEIGTGSGYQAAILAELVPEVYSVELIAPLADRAEGILAGLGYTNFKIKIGNGYEGWAEHAPYDAIMVTAAPVEVPPTLVAQLGMNGRMVLPVGTGTQELILIRKTPKGIVRQDLLPVRFVPMIDKDRRK
ncbi:MAG: protein-L-isoaspartate(D-aspartate) O-methyltransferase [Terriglobia bacterium]